MKVLIIASVLLLSSITACTTTPGGTTSPTSEPGSSPVVSQVKLKIPNVIGKNALIAEGDLRSLGFMNVEESSVDPNASVVLLLANWKVVGQEPEAGQMLRADRTIILKVVKEST